jgi:hypothetical protein
MRTGPGPEAAAAFRTGVRHRRSAVEHDVGANVRLHTVGAACLMRVLGAHACFRHIAVCVGSIGLAVVAFPLADTERPMNESYVTQCSSSRRTTRRTTPAVVEVVLEAGHQTSGAPPARSRMSSPRRALECGEPVVAIDGAADWRCVVPFLHGETYQSTKAGR